MATAAPRLGAVAGWGRDVRTRLVFGAAIIVVVIAVVSPVRRMVAIGVSRALAFVATPLTPDLGSFDELPRATTVVAADGSPLGQLGAEQRQPVRLRDLPQHVRRAFL